MGVGGGVGVGKEQGRLSTAGVGFQHLPTLHLMLLALAWLQPSQPRVEMGLGATSCSGQEAELPGFVLGWLVFIVDE